MKQKKTFRRLLPLLLALALLLSGCVSAAVPAESAVPAQPAESLRLITDPPRETEAPPPETELPAASPALPQAAEAPAETDVPQPEPAPEPMPEPSVDEDGEYTAPEDVAEYLRLYGHLPENFITKTEARRLGWSGGNLWRYAPGKSIGGDSFGNYEGALPKGSYRECDVNYSGGSRGAERLIYGTDGSIYYTDDHYISFTQLY